MIDLKVTKLFFDSEAVIKAVDKGRRVALNRIGGFIRTTARRLIRKGKGSSPPGKPPKSHVGTLKNFLFYSYDPETDSVVIGPALVKTPHPRFEPTKGTVPEILEEGGDIKLLPRKKRSSRKRRKVRTAEVESRPFMGPALQTAKDADKLSQFWDEVVR